VGDEVPVLDPFRSRNQVLSVAHGAKPAALGHGVLCVGEGLLDRDGSELREELMKAGEFVGHRTGRHAHFEE